jgi:hypothetical protein
MKTIGLALLAVFAISGQASAQGALSSGEAGVFVACFYECKPGPDVDTGTGSVGTYQELTTLMITNQSNSNRCARAFYFDGHENVLAMSNIGLSPFDLDELNVCHTLNAAAPTVPSVPEAGLVVFGFTDPTLPPVPPFPFTPSTGGYVWGKNVIGKFRKDNVEPFQGRADAVGKYECRVVPSSIFGTGQLQAKSAGASLIPAIRIEQTSEADAECGP